MAHAINPQLINLASWRLAGEGEKQAFVPTGATDPAAAAAGGDPTAAGGMPPGAGPPMDPAMAGGAPPMDPSMAGGMPPGGPPMDPAMMQMIQGVVQQTMSAMGGAPGGAPGAPGAPGAGGKGGGKIDPGMLYLELGRVRKLLDNLHRHFDVPLPNDILDDNMVAQQAAGMVPESQPIGPGDPNAQAPPGGAPGGAPGAEPAGLPAIGQSPSVQPLEGPKTAGDLFNAPVSRYPNEAVDDHANNVNALTAMSLSLRKRYQDENAA